jgi:hypothetical protein
MKPKSARLGIAFALALGAALPASFIATPASAAGYHEMHRDGRFDHRNRGDFPGWHSERGQFRYYHREHGFRLGR